MRLAFLAWSPLVPADSGYRLRTRALLRHLPARELLLLAPAPEVEGLKQAPLPCPWTTRLPLPCNSQILLFQGPTRARREALRAMEDFRPDLVWAEGLWAFPPAGDYRERTGAPVVLGVQNIEYLAAMRAERATFRSTILQRLERRTYSRCDALIACSAADGRNLHQLFSISRRRILTLPNGIEPYTEPAEEDRLALRRTPDEKVLLFAGKLDYRPNREAAEWLLNSLPSCLERLPQRFCLAIVGGPAPGRIPAHLPANVRFHLPGRVPAMAPYWEAADICLAPLFSGSGTRIKILEYLAAGKPVVATQKAVEGLELEPGKHFELAQDAPQTAATLAHLLGEPGRAQEMALRGKSHVEERFLWSRRVEEFWPQLQSLVER